MTILYLVPGIDSVIQGVPLQVSTSAMGEKGGVIVNPLDPKDQGLEVAESIWINLIAPPGTDASVNGTSELVPGQWFLVPPGATVWVNAASVGHKFTSFFSSPFKVQYPPTPVPGQPGTDTPGVGAEVGTQPFPPSHVTGLTTVIPSYLYQQYTDDDDCQAFVDSQNEMQQNYVDTFNALNLPIYPGPIVAGALLDWVARGVYGYSRPVLGSGVSNMMGPLNTYGCNWLVPMWELNLPEDVPPEDTRSLRRRYRKPAKRYPRIGQVSYV